MSKSLLNGLRLGFFFLFMLEGMMWDELQTTERGQTARQTSLNLGSDGE